MNELDYLGNNEYRIRATKGYITNAAKILMYNNVPVTREGSEKKLQKEQT